MSTTWLTCWLKFVKYIEKFERFEMQIVVKNTF